MKDEEFCPYCDSRNINAVEFFWYGTPSTNYHCEHCGMSWADIHGDVKKGILEIQKSDTNELEVKD